MKNYFGFSRWCLLLSILTLAGRIVHAEVVYSNSTNDLSARFHPGTNEVGDEIILGGGARFITNFTFQYFGSNFSGGEEAEVRFYKNDGLASPSGPLMPGSLLYDSGLFFISNTVRSTLNFNQIELGGGVLVPDSFTWSVQFSGVDSGEDAGVDLYSPPTVGINFDDYWDRNGSSWQLKTNSVTSDPINFAARIEAVPEPTALLLGVFGGLVGLAFVRRMIDRR